MTEEQIAAARNSPRAKEMLQWRLGVDMNKYKDLRKKFDSAGLDLQILCYNMSEATTDEEKEASDEPPDAPPDSKAAP